VNLLEIPPFVDYWQMNQLSNLNPIDQQLNIFLNCRGVYKITGLCIVDIPLSTKPLSLPVNIICHIMKFSSLIFIAAVSGCSVAVANTEAIGNFDLCKLYVSNLTDQSRIVFAHKSTKHSVDHAHSEFLSCTNGKIDWKVSFPVSLKEVFGRCFCLSDRKMNPTCLVFARSKNVVPPRNEIERNEGFAGGLFFCPGGYDLDRCINEQAQPVLPFFFDNRREFNLSSCTSIPNTGTGDS
jgi:hypothetical protein